MGLLGNIGDGINKGLGYGGHLVDEGKKKVGEGVDWATDKVGDGLDHVGLHDWADSVEDWGDDVASDLGATPGEQQLGQTEEANELVHGDPGKIRDGAKHLSDFHTAFDKVSAGMKKIDSSGWKGQGGDAFREKFDLHPAKWAQASAACETAAGALDAYAHTVTWAQGQAKEAVALYKKGVQASKDASDAYNKKVDAYNAKIDANQDPGPKPDPFVDPGKADVKAARAKLAEARKQRNTAASEAQGKIKAALAHAPAEPPPLSRLGDDVVDGYQAAHTELTHVTGGVLKGTAGLVDFVRGLNPVDPYNLTHPAAYLQNASMTLSGLVSTAAHPERIVQTAVDGFKKDPSEFVGRLIPQLVGTDGAGLAAGGLRLGLKTAVKEGLEDGAESAARKTLRDAPEERAGKAAEKVERDPTDPVDLTTGMMYLPQTDIELPGNLPVGFTRRVESGYRLGKWFGPSWASTVDERLEIDAEGVVLVGADGLLLDYPHPAPGVPTLPHHGPQRPLDRVDDGYTVTDPATGHVRHFADRDGSIALLEQIDDRNGNWTAFEHDSEGTPTAIVSSGGYRLLLTTAESRVTALLLAGAAPGGTGQVIKRYGYSGEGDLVEVADSAGRALRFSYDDRGRVTSWTDSNDRSYAYTYDEQDRCTAEGGTEGHVSLRLSYDDTDPRTGLRVTTTTSGAGHTRRYVVNDSCQVVAETDPLGGVTRFARDRRDRLLSRTDPLGHTQRYSYDDRGNLTRAVRADGGEIHAEYNEQNLPVKIIGTDGSAQRSSYDERGNRTSYTDVAGMTTAFTYDEAGRLTSVVDPLGGRTMVLCDAAGLPLRVTGPTGASTLYERDAFGRPISITDPSGATTRLEWTVEGQLARRTAPDGATESWTYDGEGNCTSHTDPLGGTTLWEYTHFDLMTARTDPDGVRHEFTHDTELRLTGVTNPRGETWTYTYDEAGRLVSETDFDNRVVGYAHDAADRLTSRVNHLGQTIQYERDVLGRVVSKTVDGRVTTYAFDLTDQLAQATGPDGSTVTLLRDRSGNVRTETVDGRSLHFTHDALGRRTSRTTPGGATTTWSYDEPGNVTGMTVSGRPITFAHDGSGREVSRSVAGALTTARVYDPSGRLTAQTAVAEGRTVQQRTYTYRADGHLTAMDDLLAGKREFHLDVMGRVTAVRAANWTETYAYDAAGNQAGATWPATHPGHEATGEREYSGTSLVRAGNVRYEHDALGRVTLRQKTRLSRKPDTWRYEWDAEDRLASAVTPDGTRWRYTYDPLGRRTAKIRLAADSETVVERTTFTWDGTTLCEQTSSSAEMPNPVITTWDHRGLHPISQTERITTAEAPHEEIDSRFFSIITDLVGTPTELVDEHGAVAWHARATLWGITAWRSDARAHTPLRFPGQYHDPETGLHYNHHRYYDPETARYTTPDPLGLAPAPNPATYVHNPHTWSDPLGLAPRCLNETGEDGRDTNENFVPGSAEAQRLADQLRRDSAGSIFNENGWLTPQAITDSRRVIDGEKIGNPAVREAMTSDGSNLGDWGKYTTKTHQSPYGDFQVHYYYNPETGRVLNYDYKVILNRR
ncbi:putative T7SS-secreted protein [Streptomyces tremellae]|uniref:Type IV secretion protein Rhs n=1 Tax=Streptomyces tremellae TaxID=1124239 RepID=A0ABP7F9I6_9ACTN